MNIKNQVTQTIVIFIALATTGICIAVSTRFMMQPFEQMVMVTVGSAIFGASLTFFLVRVLSLIEK